MDCVHDFKNSVLQNVQINTVPESWSHPLWSLWAPTCKNWNLVVQIHFQNSVDRKGWDSVSLLLKNLCIQEWDSSLELVFGETAARVLSTQFFSARNNGLSCESRVTFLSSREKWKFKYISVHLQILGLKKKIYSGYGIDSRLFSYVLNKHPKKWDKCSETINDLWG